MKKVICLFLCMILLLPGCAKQDEQMLHPVTFYYKVSEPEYGENSPLIASEVRDLKEHKSDYNYVLNEYLNGPRKSGCISPFPAGTTLDDMLMGGTKVNIVLSGHFTYATSSEMMLACACLTKTVTELTGVKTVQISVSTGDINGQEYLRFTADDFRFIISD